MKTVDFIRRSISDDLVRYFSTSFDVSVTFRTDFYKISILCTEIGCSLIDFVREHYLPSSIVIFPVDDYSVKLSFRISCTKD